MKYQIASKNQINDIINMKNRVKQRIINQNLPMWLNGYPLDEYIIEDIENNYGRVVIVGEVVAAYAAFYPANTEYNDELDDLNQRYSYGRVMVDDFFLGQGIGRFLVEKMLNEAKSLGYKGMMITGDDFNTKAITLYKSLGFKKIGEKQFPYAYLSIFTLDF